MCIFFKKNSAFLRRAYFVGFLLASPLPLTLPSSLPPCVSLLILNLFRSWVEWEIKIQETSPLGVPHTGRRVVKKQGLTLTGRSIGRIEKQIRFCRVGYVGNRVICCVIMQIGDLRTRVRAGADVTQKSFFCAFGKSRGGGFVTRRQSLKPTSFSPTMRCKKCGRIIEKRFAK